MLEKLNLKNKNKNLIIILLAAGVALIFFSTYISNNNSNKSNLKEKANSATSEYSEEDYKNNLQENLKDTISKINGVGNIKVMVTMESSAQKEYATEKKVNTENGSNKTTDKTETAYIKVKDSDGSEHAISLTEYAPKVRGVVIICDGGDQPYIKEKVTDVVVAAVGVSSSHVCVTK